MREGIPEFAILVLMMMSFLAGAGAGGCTATTYMKTEAVKRNAAQWKVDVDGTTTFEWKSEPVVKPEQE